MTLKWDEKLRTEQKAEAKLKKEIYGQLFRGEILNQIYGLCEDTLKADYEGALKILAKNSSIRQPQILLENIVNVLETSRLTINFDFSKVSDINSKSPEVVNCFAYRDKPNEIPNYNVGRANTEELVFYLNKLFNDSEYQAFGRYANVDGDQTRRSANFQWTSRPCYAALDVLANRFGGAPMYGKSFLILKDYVKHNCTYSPYDTYSPPILSSISKDKICTFFHFARLIRYCQNSWFGYNCLKNLIKKANKEDVAAHDNYGKSTGNYIEAHIYARVLFWRDIEQICLAEKEFYSYPISQQKKMLEKIDEINSFFGYSFITFIRNELKDSNEMAKIIVIPAAENEWEIIEANEMWKLNQDLKTSQDELQQLNKQELLERTRENPNQPLLKNIEIMQKDLIAKINKIDNEIFELEAEDETNSWEFITDSESSFAANAVNDVNNLENSQPKTKRDHVSNNL